MVDERTGEEIVRFPETTPGCEPSALGAGTLVFPCGGPKLVSVDDGSARVVPFHLPILQTGSMDVQAVGAHWLWMRVTPYKVDDEYLVDETGGYHLIRSSIDGDPYEVDLPPDEVVDLDAASGTRRLCASIRRHSYRRPELFFRADDRGAVWSVHGVWLQRCGHPPVRLSRDHGERFVATRRTVAWIVGATAIAVDRRTLARRSWELPRPSYFTDLALSHRRLWVNTNDRRGHPVVLTGRLPR